jgi:hypothetical protein
MSSFSGQVFLGGASGVSTWRRDVAIPALEAAGISYCNPQLPPGAWTPAMEGAEMLAKDAAEVLVFVLNGETRGVATVAEAAYYLAAARPLALAIADLEPGAVIEGHSVSASEAADLNRGRLFLRTMARLHAVPVHDTVPAAIAHAIALVHARAATLTLPSLQQVLDEIHFDNCRFHAAPLDGGFLLHLSFTLPCAATGQPAEFTGRHWHIPASATRADVVRTALKAALTWQEHEARERFTYRGKPIFSPHADPDRLLQLSPG